MSSSDSMPTEFDYDWDRLAGLYPTEFIEKMKGLDGKACWKGYKQMGTKKKGGRTVDNCVPINKDAEHKEGDEGYEFGGKGSGRRSSDWIQDRGDRIQEKEDPDRLKMAGTLNRIKTYTNWAKDNPGKFNEGDIATAEMTPNYLPKEPGSKDLKNPQMGEQKIRMPRMEEIAKASNKNGQLAMAAAPNYSETEDFNDAFHSMEPNAQMVITQLRVIREKVDIMLGMLYPDDNLEPWVTTKVANASMGLAAASDYLRFGGEIQ